MLTLAFQITANFVFRGFIEGLTYGMVALGLVLIYKASGVVNFAQSNFGAFGAFTMALINWNYGIPIGVGIPLAIIIGGLLGGVTELLVVRRLFYQPRLLLFVATLGVSQLIQYLAYQMPEQKRPGVSVKYPEIIDFGNNPWKLGPVDIRGDQLSVLIVVPLACAILAYLLTRTKFGLSVRAAADNPNAASLAGISVKNVSTQVWVLAGVLSAISAILFGPLSSDNMSPASNALGPSLLLKALTAGMVGRMQSFPLALAGGIGIGIVETIIKLNTETFGSGAEYTFLFILLLLLVLIRGAKARDEGGWALPKLRAANRELANIPAAKWVTRLVIVGLGAAALLRGLTLDKGSDYQRYTVVLVFMIVAISSTVLTGWAGQLSLGQFAFVGVGAYATGYYSEGLPLPISLLLGVVWGVGLAIVIGLPALRLKGLNLAIITLGFQLLCAFWLFGLDRLSTGSGNSMRVHPENRKFFKWDLVTNLKATYFVTLVALVLITFMATMFRRSGIGRSVVAVRDNENAASAFTISPVRAKLVSFAVSGGIAALAGGLYAVNFGRQFNPDLVQPDYSLRIVSIAVVGGISSVIGAIMGSFIVQGLPTIFEGNDEVNLFASSIGMLVIIMYFPGGLISIIQNLRDLLYGWIAKRVGYKPKPKAERAAVAQLSARPKEVKQGVLPLKTDDVTVRFFGRAATDHVSITVNPGEVVGLIGTNGAGKTTFMNAVSGFLPSTGQIEVFGERVDGMPGYKRARLGVGRAFQNAKMFGALTARETIQVALEARSRSLLIPSMFYLPPSPFQERRKRKEADEIIDYIGLGRYADTTMSELSTGTRRIVELASLIALDAKLLLLDEPTAGVAQKETEAFGPLIRSIQQDLGSSILIIEHDMPMVMSISDRIYCLEAGAVISEGSPLEVRNDPKVIASYLGTDERAINRSEVTVTRE